jgi:hypothetical protein
MEEGKIQSLACFSETPEERIMAIKKLNFNENNLKVIVAISSLDPDHKVRHTASSILKKVILN